MAKKQNNGQGITLKDALGAILKDVTESRHLSDIYSRDLSRTYEADDILKTYPVPRTEIKELDIDLKFAFNNMVKEDTDAMIIRRRIVHMFIIYDKIITNKIIDTIKSSLEKRLLLINDDKKEEKEDIIQIIEKLKEDKFYDNLAEYIFDNLYWSLNYWTYENKPIKDRLKDFGEFSKSESDPETKKEDVSTFDIQKLIDKVLSVLIYGIEIEWSKEKKKFVDPTYDQRGKKYDPILGEKFFGNQFDFFKKEIKEKLRFELWNIVQDMRNRFEYLNQELRQINAYILVKANELKELESEKLCSINIKTVIKNYLWTEIDKNTDRLVPE